MSIDKDGIPRIYDTFGVHRIARAKVAMRKPIHLMEPTTSVGREGKAPAQHIFATIADTIDVRIVTDLMIDFLNADEDKTEMRLKERQAVCESGFRRLVELCNKRSVNQMRWIGEHNENMKVNHDQLRRVLSAMGVQSICTDVGNDCQGGSNQNRGCEVALTGLQFLLCMLLPTGNGGSDRQLIYRDAWFTCRAAEVVTKLLHMQGACSWLSCQKKAISCKVAEYGIQCMYILIQNSDGNCGYALSIGALEAIMKSNECHRRMSPRVRKAADSTLKIILSMKNDPAYLLEAEAQKLKIIAEQPGATTEDRVAAAKAAARVQVVRMDRAK